MNLIDTYNNLIVKVKLSQSTDVTSADSALNPYLKRETVADNIWFSGKTKEGGEKTTNSKKNEEKKVLSYSEIIAEKQRERRERLRKSALKYVGVEEGGERERGVRGGESMDDGNISLDADFQMVSSSCSYSISCCCYCC